MRVETRDCLFYFNKASLTVFPVAPKITETVAWFMHAYCENKKVEVAGKEFHVKAIQLDRFPNGDRMVSITLTTTVYQLSQGNINESNSDRRVTRQR